MSSDELRPCPYCGEVDPILIQYGKADVTVKRYAISCIDGFAYTCRRCSARGGVVAMTDYEFIDVAERIARELWNRREDTT